MLDKRSIALLRPVRWTPRELPGLQLWLSAAREAARRGLAPGQSVTLDTWADLSGKGNHVTQGTASRRPVLRHDGTRWVVQFDGVDDFVSRDNPSGLPSGTAERTVLAGFSHGRSGDGVPVNWGPAPSTFTREAYIVLANASASRVTATAYDGARYGAASWPSGLHVVTSRYPPGQTQASAVQMWRDGASLTLGLLAGADGPINTITERLVIGTFFDPVSPGWLQGDITAALVYTRALSDAERKRVERYLDREARLGLGL